MESPKSPENDISLTNFLNEIRVFLTQSQIETRPAELQHLGQDWSKAMTVRAKAALFPTSTEQVSGILCSASRHGIPIIPSGGRTGLSGGAVAQAGEVILSLTRLNFIGTPDPSALSLRVGAGAVTEAVHQACEPHGLTWPVDFASKGSSTVGGNIATNAGGVRVLRYGNTRNWVLGLTAVTMDGSIHHLNGELEKNNTGYDLRQLLIGSEGTLAVVTEATLKLASLPRSSLVFFFALRDFQAVTRLFAWARARIPSLSAFECLDRACYGQALQHFRHSPPFPSSSDAEQAEAYVLIEVESQQEESDALSQAEHWLAGIFETGLVIDGVMASSARESRKLWQIREGIAESILHGALVHQEDVSVPIGKLEAFYATIQARYAEAFPGFAVFFFGHIGDGNLHIFVRKPDHVQEEEFKDRCKAADLELFKTLQAFQGSVSAEHGIGLLKKHALPFSRTPQEIALFRGIKRAFDPQGLLNPGKILDA